MYLPVPRLPNEIFLEVPDVFDFAIFIFLAKVKFLSEIWGLRVSTPFHAAGARSEIDLKLMGGVRKLKKLAEFLGFPS